MKPSFTSIKSIKEMLHIPLEHTEVIRLCPIHYHQIYKKFKSFCSSCGACPKQSFGTVMILKKVKTHHQPDCKVTLNYGGPICLMQPQKVAQLTTISHIAKHLQHQEVFLHPNVSAYLFDSYCGAGEWPVMRYLVTVTLQSLGCPQQ